MQRMTVIGLSVDTISNMPMIVLKSESSGIFLPVWLGTSEALHLSMAQTSISFDSPLVHEAIAHLLCELDGTMVNCSVLDVKEGVFIVAVELQVQGKIIAMPCRFADGVALALRLKAPIFVATHVLDKVTRDRAKMSASPEERRPADMTERLVSKVLPEHIQNVLMPQKKQAATAAKTHEGSAKRDDSPESIADKILREMEPSSRRIM